jgi:hypothetical protein
MQITKIHFATSAALAVAHHARRIAANIAKLLRRPKRHYARQSA